MAAIFKKSSVKQRIETGDLDGTWIEGLVAAGSLCLCGGGREVGAAGRFCFSDLTSVACWLKSDFHPSSVSFSYLTWTRSEIQVGISEVSVSS